MDFIVYYFENSINFFVAIIPLASVYIQRHYKVDKKVILSCLSLNFILSLYFWIQLGDIIIVIPQIIPYVVGYVLVLSEYLVNRIKNKKLL